MIKWANELLGIGSPVYSFIGPKSSQSSDPKTPLERSGESGVVPAEVRIGVDRVAEFRDERSADFWIVW